MLNERQKKIAIHWYVNKGFSLETISQHYGLSVEELIKEIRTRQ